MKQLLKGVLLLCAAAALTACGAKSEAASSVVTVLPEPAPSSAVTAPAPEHPVQLPESSTAGASDIHAGMDADLDLTQLSSTVVYAEVYNIDCLRRKVRSCIFRGDGFAGACTF